MNKQMPELPLFQCHKQVRAAKILSITGPEGFTDGHAELVLDLQDTRILPVIGHMVVDVAASWLTRNPAVAVGGYFVQYLEGDSYSSYSPAGPFEGGYTLVGGK